MEPEVETLMQEALPKNFIDYEVSLHYNHWQASGNLLL